MIIGSIPLIYEWQNIFFNKYIVSHETNWVEIINITKCQKIKLYHDLFNKCIFEEKWVEIIQITSVKLLA